MGLQDQKIVRRPALRPCGTDCYCNGSWAPRTYLGMVRIHGRSNPYNWGVLVHSQFPTKPVLIANHAGPWRSGHTLDGLEMVQWLDGGWWPMYIPCIGAASDKVLAGGFKLNHSSLAPLRGSFILIFSGCYATMARYRGQRAGIMVVVDHWSVKKNAK